MDLNAVICLVLITVVFLKEVKKKQKHFYINRITKPLTVFLIQLLSGLFCEDELPPRLNLTWK